jgi:thiosulfate reductase cytochrome b subunit
MVTGFVILMAHPRLYWGAAGNDLTPAFLELPISRNYRHGGWTQNVPFFSNGAVPVVTASRTYDIFNQNGWARSLHFLAGWFLATVGSLYVVMGLLKAHIRRNLLPTMGELAPHVLWQDLLAHLRRSSRPGGVGPPYNILQKCAYSGVVLLALPTMVLTGLAMSPAVTAAYPALADVFGGSQSARTIHFLTFGLIVLFVVIHLTMVLMCGFRRQLRGMTLGS